MTDTSPASTKDGIETRDVLAVMSTLLFVAAYFAPWVWGIPKDASTYLGQFQGAVIVQWAGIMGWYFGSSKGSDAKSATIDTLANKVDGQ